MQTEPNITKPAAAEPTISAAELRQILYGADNQDMTVRALRHALFALLDQDARVPVDSATLQALGVR